MKSNDYMKKLYQDMQLRGYTEHTQEVYGRVVGKFLNVSGKSVEALDEHDVRNYVLHLMNSDLSKSSINTYQAAVRFIFGVTLKRSMNYYFRTERSEVIYAMFCGCRRLRRRAKRLESNVLFPNF